MKFSLLCRLGWPDDRAQGDAFHAPLEQLTRAESQGYHGVWLAPQHASHHGIGPTAQLAASHLAARTQKIRIGTVLSILPIMHPLRLAEEAAMLDIVTGGRLDWAVASAAPTHETWGREAEASEEGQSEAGLLFQEQLGVMEKAWSGKAFDHAGAFYRFDGVRCYPEPSRAGGPPVYIADSTRGSLEWAARNGYPILADPFSPLARILENHRAYSETAAAAGRAGPTPGMPLMRPVHVGASNARAREEVERAFDMSVFGDPRYEPHPRNEPTFASWLDRCAIVGDAGFCRERIADIQQDLELEHLVAWHGFGTLSAEQSLASQERLIHEVAPAFA